MEHPPASDPYAAPASRAEPVEGPPEPAGPLPVFYAISPLKAFVMSWLTFGVYDLVFWWRHWKVRRARGHDVSVFWRTFWSPLFFSLRPRPGD